MSTMKISAQIELNTITKEKKRKEVLLCVTLISTFWKYNHHHHVSTFVNPMYSYVTHSDKTWNKGHLWYFQLLISSEPLPTKL